MTLPKNILVGTDFGPCSERALEDALDIARKVGARVHLVHAFEVPGMSDGGSMMASIEDAELRAQRKMEQLAEPHRESGLLAAAVVRLGDPAGVVLREAEQVGADLIVLGTHGRKGLSRLLVGSVAESVVRATSRPVLVARGKAA